MHLLITVVAPLRCTIRIPTRCVKRRCISACLAHPTTLLPRQVGADAVRLAGKPYPDGQFLWWLQRDHGLRQSQSGREQSLPLRSATESKLSAVGGALWRCSTAGPSRRPQDKAKVEVSVQIVERWILARLRHCRFCSLAQLNASIKELLEELNRKPFKQMLSNRLDTFKRFEQPELRPLPLHPYQYVEIKRARSTLITTFTMSVTITRYRISMWA